VGASDMVKGLTLPITIIVVGRGAGFWGREPIVPYRASRQMSVL